MSKILLRGITWQRRRAVEPLVASAQAFRRERPDIQIDWRSRPLASFEFQPVEGLAAAYDLIVLDHPHAGDIARTACLVPVDERAAAQPAADAFVGPSLESYRNDGRLWALPLDAACQTAVHRPDLLAHCSGEVPRTWAEHAATRWEIREWIEVGQVAVVQPDINRCGGFTEIRRIAEMAELYGAQVIPHGCTDGRPASRPPAVDISKPPVQPHRCSSTYRPSSSILPCVASWCRPSQQSRTAAWACPTPPVSAWSSTPPPWKNT